jgi:phosphatidylinositol alpha-1,6-mannosyltransferase
LFVPAIRRCDYFLANSSNTARLAQESGIKPESIRILHPGVTLPYGDVAPDFHDMAGTRGKRILLSVGRLTARKGIVEFVEKCMPEIVAACPDVVLVIIGGEANQALHQKHSAGIREAIVKAAQKMEIETHIRLLGHVSDGLLKAAYMESHLFVFPILELPGDIEGFGIVALEAASFGLPTAAFASGGVQDAVSPNLSGYLVKPSDYKTLTKTIINHFQQHRFKTMRNSCIDFAKNFTWNSFGDELRKVCYNFIITK